MYCGGGMRRRSDITQVEQDAQKVVAMERKLAALSSSKQVSLRVCADLESRLSSTGAGQGSEHEGQQGSGLVLQCQWLMVGCRP